ncbi:MAG: glutamine-hydrolyzing GMP synthase [Bacteroidaceae bacterium]|nr:glutamine-hydrolyzing GMP synthase [Bacteroidaceae bacterium]
MKQDMIVILDLGSHENTVLARAIRALGVYSEIYPHDITVEELKSLPNVKGIIINGGPNNVIDGVEIDVNHDIYNAGFPIMSAGHDKALCDVKLAQFTDNVEAIKEAVKGFVFDTCKAEANWNMKNFVNDQVELIRRQVGDRKVLLALSGGVDSSVVAALLLKAIGNNLVCVHVNHGLMRKGESENVIEVFRNQLCANLVYVDATDRFLGKLECVEDPEQKRKIIGGEFIRVFEEEARKLDGIDFLGQGTIYPDIVESGTKTAKMVKSHHNVGGLPDDMQFALVEPIRQLFKDEVRACGLELGLPYEMVYRQPFPGPGLGVRCLGAITRDRLEAVRESDAILREEFAKAGLDKKVWQYFTIVPDFKSVGVKDNARSYDWPVIIRAVNTVDAMTATIEQIDWPILLKITDRILAEVKNVNRVCYDMSPKPSATIEWE